MAKVKITPLRGTIRGVKAGQPLEVSARDAKILIAAHRAVYYTEPVERKRVYKRRDMEAESAPVAPPVVAAPEVLASAPQPDEPEPTGAV